MEKYDNQSSFFNLIRQPYSTLYGDLRKNCQLLDIVECVETCKHGLVLLVGGLTDEEQNNVATSLTVT